MPEESVGDFLQRIANYANYGNNEQFLKFKEQIIKNESAVSDSIILSSIIQALCEYYKLCPTCYRNMDGMNCSKCEEYYTDCGCDALSPSEILEGKI